MASPPASLDLKRHGDLAGREGMVWIRRTLIALLCLIPILALLNVFGQRPHTHRGDAPAAAMKVYSPLHLRSGLYFEARFSIHALQDVKNATLLLSSGWLEGMTLNTIEPGPIGEASRDGSIAMELGHIPAGKTHLLFLHFQVNPTNIGRRDQSVDLYDGETKLFHIARTVTVWP
jgi:hypothetical protein